MSRHRQPDGGGDGFSAHTVQGSLLLVNQEDMFLLIVFHRVIEIDDARFGLHHLSDLFGSGHQRSVIGCRFSVDFPDQRAEDRGAGGDFH